MIRLLPFLIYALVILIFTAARHLDDPAERNQTIRPEIAQQVCKSACNEFSACAEGKLPPHISGVQFYNGCLSGCVKHAHLVVQCNNSDADSCEEKLSCMLNVHFGKNVSD